MSDSKLASGKNRSTKTGANLDNQITLEFDDNHLFASLCGEHDAHLARIEHQLGLQIASRGNRLALIGPPEAVDTARTALETLWQRLKHGLEVGPAEIDAVLRSAMGNLDEAARAAALRAIGAGTSVVERGKPGSKTGRGSTGALMPRSPTQARYLQAMADSALVFGVGPAGTGKTYLAVAEAVRRFLAEEVDRIIITRPAVEAGERLGFLPGDMRDKVDPY
ncbi:MAG: PhoH family protein, partial [Pseudomonadota bacterium]